MNYAIWCTRSGVSIFGADSTWAKSNGGIIRFPTMQEAQVYAADLNRRFATANLHYEAREFA